MSLPPDFGFTPATREQIAAQCAAFPRQSSPPTAAPLKSAAVAIALVEAESPARETAFLLTRRVATLRAHSGQWALPGGRCDLGESPAQAALRELEEELGLKLAPSDVLGVLDDYATRSGYLITPVVVWGGAGATVRANPMEVAAAYRIPLTDIVGDVISFEQIPESDRPVVRILINGVLVNAPTAALLYQFRELISGRITRVASYEQPVFAWR
jgi:8-oxo-dGTP pyrophosphatase MutT (NUDIX family)